MRATLLVLFVVACGGVDIPMHSGYKNDKVKPWKKPKPLKFDDKLEAKVEGDLSYVQMKRAAWYAIDIAQPSALDLKVEVTPPGDGVNEDFDLAFEVLDPGYRIISKSDLEEEDAHELNKTRLLKDLTPGRYLLHLYLQSRLDSADYSVVAALKPTSGQIGSSDFPAAVQFPSPLAMVPINDDTPAGWRPPVATNGKRPRTPRTPTTEKPPTTDKPPTTGTGPMTARIIGMAVNGSSTTITIGRGTSGNAAAGMKFTISGIPDSFTLSACSTRTCTATVKATPDQLKSGSVTITP